MSGVRKSMVSAYLLTSGSGCVAGAGSVMEAVISVGHKVKVCCEFFLIFIFNSLTYQPMVVGPSPRV
jgi:hypothetical protein